MRKTCALTCHGQIITVSSATVICPVRMFGNQHLPGHNVPAFNSNGAMFSLNVATFRHYITANPEMSTKFAISSLKIAIHLGN